MRRYFALLGLALLTFLADRLSAGWTWSSPEQISPSDAYAKTIDSGNAPAVAYDSFGASPGVKMVLSGYYSSAENAVKSCQGPFQNPRWQTTTIASYTAPNFGSTPAFAYTHDDPDGYKHAIWKMAGFDADSIYYARGSRATAGWDQPFSLFSGDPELGEVVTSYSMATYNARVNAVWTKEDGTFSTICSKFSTDHGATWSGPQVYSTADHTVSGVSVATSGMTVIAAWLMDDDQGMDDIWCRRSTDGGATWYLNSPQFVIGNVDQDCVPSIAFAGSFVYVTGQGTDDANTVLLNYSSDNGASWDAGRRIPVRPPYPVQAPEYGATKIYAHSVGSVFDEVALASASTLNGQSCCLVQTLLRYNYQGEIHFAHWSCDTFNVTPSAASVTGFVSDQDPNSRLLKLVYLKGGGGNNEDLDYRSAVWTYFIPPQGVVWGGNIGPGGIARASGSAEPQAAQVMSVDSGNFVTYCQDPGSPSGGWNAVDVGTSATMSLDGAGNPWVSYIRHGNSCETLYAAVRNANSSWAYVPLYGTLSGQHLGPPSLGIFQGSGTNRLGNVVFPCYDNVAAHSLILYAQFDSSGSVILDTLDDLAGKYTDSSACLVVGLTDTITTCYGRGDSVYERKLVYAPNSMCRPDAWSSASLIDSGAVVTSSHPSVEKIGSRLWVAFTQRSISGNDTTWAIKQASCSLLTAGVVWEGLTTVSAANSKHKDFPSISTSRVITWAESSAGHWLIKAKVGDSLMTLTSPDSDSRFCSVQADTGIQNGPSTNMTRIRWLWSQRYLADTWQIKYSTLDVNASNADANVTMYNQGKKIAIDGLDSTHVCYRTLAGSINYAKKKDGVEGWNSSLLRNTGDMPCLDCDYLNRVWVADRCFQGTAPMYDVIRCQTKAAGSGTWTDFQVFSSQMPTGSTIHKIGPPAIVACIGDTGGQSRTASYVIFTVYEPMPGSGKSTIIMAKVSTTGVIYYDTLRTVNGKGDSFPSLALHPTAGQGYCIHACWQESTEVYVKKTTNQDQPQFLTKRTWSSFYNLSNTAGKSKHCVIAADTDAVIVAWSEGDSGRILTRSQTPSLPYNFWNDTVNVSGCPDTCCDYPSIALSHGDSTIVEYQKKLSSTNYDIIARVNFHSNLNISNTSTSSTYPHCIIHLHQDSIPVISTVWTEALSTNYAGVGYKRWQLGHDGGGGQQSVSVFDPGIRPMLFAPAPNPFAGTTTIKYQTNVEGRTSVVIHDVTGRRVCNLMTTYQRPGIYSVTWTGRDDRQRLLPEGIYFVRLSTPNYCEARKLILTQ